MTTTSTQAKLDTLVKALTLRSGIEFTLGYVGDLTPRGEDRRTWYVFASHPGRVGGDADRIGGVPTADLADLVPMLQGALALVKVQTRQAQDQGVPYLQPTAPGARLVCRNTL